MGDPLGPELSLFFGFMSTLKLLILKIVMHMRSTNPGRYLIFFLIKFPVECRYNHVWGPIFDPSYDHIYKSQERQRHHQLEVRGFTGTTDIKPSELLTPRVHENITA